MQPAFHRRGLLTGLAAASTALVGDGWATTQLPDEQPLLMAKGATAPAALQADVLVVGAGASGVPAAIAAARGGATVLLLEEDQLPGGAPVDMFVASLCGFPRVGIFQEMVTRLTRHAGLRWPRHDNWYMPTSYAQVLLAMLKAEKNIRLCFGATVDGVFVSEGGRNRVRGVCFRRRDGSVQNVMAAMTIDATGTGSVAAFAGCKYMYGREARSDFGEPLGPATADAKVLPCTLLTINQRLQPESPTKPYQPEILLDQAARVDCTDTRDPICLAESYRQAINLIAGHIEQLNQQGFAVHVAPKLGVREVRRILGETVVTVNDLKDAKHPADAVAIGKYFIDAVGEKEHNTVPLPPFAIPYRALLPKNTDGLLLAGKAISGTHLALSAYRVQPIMAAIGQAAGAAAALAVRNKTDAHSVPLSELQQTLKQDGVLTDEWRPG